MERLTNSAMLSLLEFFIQLKECEDNKSDVFLGCFFERCEWENLNSIGQENNALLDK